MSHSISIVHAVVITVVKIWLQQYIMVLTKRKTVFIILRTRLKNSVRMQ